MADPVDLRRSLQPSSRERLAVAVVDEVLERGYEATTIEAVIERAGVKRVDFDRNFAGKEACVLNVVDDGIERFRVAVLSAYEQHEVWRDGLRAAAYAAARWVRENPRYILFSTIMMNPATDLARTHRDMALQEFARIVDDGRRELADPNSISPDTAITVIGSIYERLSKELSRNRGTSRAESVVPELMYIAVRPYLGHEVAREELAIPPPSESEEDQRGRG
jgi:AcrR family transcriptional regulator